MKKIIVGLIILLLLPLVLAVTDEEREQARAEVEELRDEISAQCQEDPYTCSCERIPCQEILSAENEEAEKYYKKC